MSDVSLDRVVARIKRLEVAQRHANRTPQLTRSSIDNGAVNVYDGAGQLTGVIGKQYDGSTGAVVVAGPTPPVPAAPSMRQELGGVAVVVDGSFAQTDADRAAGRPTVAPMDFRAFEVQVSETPGFGVGDGTRGGMRIQSEAGGELFVPWRPGVDLYARVVCWTLPGKFSAPSATAGPVSSGKVAQEDLGFELGDLGGTTIFYGTAAPTAGNTVAYGDLWLKEVAAGPPPQYETWRWVPGSPDAWVKLADQGVTDALVQAAAAQQTADDANALAVAASSAVASKITSYYQTSAPTSGMVSGDFWLDTDDGNKLYRYSGTAWVAVQDTAIQTALTNAGTAQAVADRKVQTFYRTAAPANPADSLGAGDLWFDTDDGNKLYRWSGTAWQVVQDAQIGTALANAATAQSTANAKITTFVQTSPPASGMSTGDLWLDSDDGNKLHRYSGSAWVAVQDAAIQTALTNAASAANLADSKITTYYQISAPAGLTAADAGDLWLDSDDGNKLYRYSGTAWVAVQDSAIQTALANAATAQSTAASKITTFVQTAAPTSGMSTGDLWLDSDDGNKLHRYSGSAWVAVQDTAIQTALTNAASAANLADSKITTYYQTAAPTGLTAADAGDLWFDTDDGNKLYRYSGTAWVLAQDAQIGTALANAATAQSTASGKITAFYQTSAPASGMQDKDIWVDTDDGNKLYRWNAASSQWVSIQDAAIQTALTNAATAQSTADGKVRIFAQPTAPTGLTADDVGDMWVDTDDGNKLYTWGTSTTVRRDNLAVNSSFEYDPAATLAAGAAPTGWTQSVAGTTGTVTASIVASGATFGTKTAKIVGATLSTLNTSWIGYQQAGIPAAAGDVFRVAVWLSFAVTSTSQRPEFQVEWLDSTGTVLSTLTDTSQATMGTAGSRTPVYTTTAAPANTASMRLAVRRRGTLTTGGTNVTNADLSLDAVLVERNRPASAPTGYFDGSSGGEARFTGTDHLSASYTFQDGTAGAYAWQPRQLRTGAFQPQSVIAKDIIATGTISAALLEAVLVLASIVIAGDPSGTHTKLDPTGLAFYADDPVDGVPNEVNRFGQTSAGRDPVTGEVTWLINAQGHGAFRSSSVEDESAFTVGGSTLTDRDWSRPWGNVPGDAELVVTVTTDTYWGAPRTNAELGLAEFAFVAQPGRRYSLSSEPFELRCATGDTAYLRIRQTTNGTTPTVSSTKLREYVVAPIRNGFSGSRQYSATFNGPAAGAAAQTYRLLMTYGVGNGSTGVQAGAFDRTFRFTVEDIGPARPNIAQYSAGSGTVAAGEVTPPAPPTTEKVTRTITYFGNWSRSWREDGSFRADVGSAMYQGKAENGNGIQGGAWAWHDITGDLAGATINQVDLFLYCEHSWFSNGMIAQIGTHGALALPTVWPGQFNSPFQTTFARNQGKWMTVNGWGAGIQNGSIRGITVYINSTDPTYYGRFTGVGPTNAPALRVTYTR
jgi:uncharacterized membrane protein